MDTAFLIARRYLFAKKSHNVINVISTISAIGLAVGTAALILILSIYNGFDSIVRSNLTEFDPDILIVREDGRFFCQDSLSCLPALKECPEVLDAAGVLETEIFISYEGEQGVATMKGIDSPELIHGELSLAFIGAGLAHKMGINPHLMSSLELYYADREKPISMIDPTSSLRHETVYPAKTFSVSSAIDDKMVLVPVATARELYGGDLSSGIELHLEQNDDAHVKAFKEVWKSRLDEGFVMKDRTEQHPDIFRMMKVEKAVVFLILILIIIIVALNIYGSMSMLVIEKREDIATLRALGADGRFIRRVFRLEGWLISMAGMVSGLLIGVLAALAQQHFGIIKMPGGFVVEAYPVVLKASDVLISAVGVALIGFLIAACCRPEKE